MGNGNRFGDVLEDEDGHDDAIENGERSEEFLALRGNSVLQQGASAEKQHPTSENVRAPVRHDKRGEERLWPKPRHDAGQGVGNGDVDERVVPPRRGREHPTDKGEEAVPKFGIGERDPPR